MSQRYHVLLLCLGLAAPLAAQTAPNPTQQGASRQDEAPVFRVTVVGRTIPTVNYRPRSGETKVDLVGTALMPNAKGSAEIQGQKGYIEIEAKFQDLEAPMRFGREYLTYVLWAITPEGRATNLGELQVKNNDEIRRLTVTTDLQAFGLIVTAEPYFAVTRPSDVVVMENMIRKGTDGRVEPLEARYELLKRGTYLVNQAETRLNVKALEPGAPLDLAEARNAVELARLARADRYATETFSKAAQLLAEAEQARERRRRGNEVMMPARQAAQTAEDARIIALQKQEEEAVAQQQALARQRELEAAERARAEQLRREQAEAEQLAAERQRSAADAARLEAEREKASAETARLKAERLKADADAARSAAEAARRAAEGDAQRAQDAAAQAEREKAQLRADLQRQLNLILETRETARGLIVNLSDVLFDFNRATLKPGAREKLSKISGIVLAHPGLTLEVEGHTDSIGSDNYNQRLSERRAESVQTYLVQQGISPTTVAALGFGESRPVATNGTSAGRQQNRRVELVVSGEPIGAAPQQGLSNTAPQQGLSNRGN